MHFRPLSISPHAAAAVLCLSLCAVSDVKADEQTDEDRIQQLITDLDSRDFRTRKNAADALKKSGDKAISPLKEALKTATVDRRQLIRPILDFLEQNSFAARITKLEALPTAAAAAEFPEWDRFSKLVPEKDAVPRYLKMLKAAPDLFRAASESPDALPDLLQQHAEELVRTTRPSPGQQKQFSSDAYAALLLFAGNELYRLPGATSHSVSAILEYKEFHAACSEKSNAWYLRLAGRYILRKRISPIIPLRFARTFQLPEGLPLARSVVKEALRGTNGIYAMALIREQGTKDDVALLESVFNNRRSVVNGRLRNGVLTGYDVLNGDIALAVAISLRGKDPRDFGFPELDDRSLPFSFSMETTGFKTEQDRRNAHAEYKKAFPVKP